MSAQRPLLYLQCQSGASGDMLVGALLGLFAPESAPAALARVVAPALAAAGIDPAVAHVASGVSGGLAAQRFTVDDLPGFATFAALDAALRRSTLDRALADGVAAVAARMAAAERAVHGAAGGEHLHELAGLDTAVDLISVLALVAALDPARIVASPPVLGGGTVITAHRRAARADPGRP